MAPQNDTFLSCGLDSTIRMWDVSAPKCIGIIKLKLGSTGLNTEAPCVGYDCAGTDFCKRRTRICSCC